MLSYLLPLVLIHVLFIVLFDVSDLHFPVYCYFHDLRIYCTHFLYLHHIFFFFFKILLLQSFPLTKPIHLQCLIQWVRALPKMGLRKVL